MDLGNPWALFCGIVIGLIGMVVFVHGKKQTNIRCMATGVALCGLPYFVGSIALLCLLCAAGLAFLYVAGREG